LYKNNNYKQVFLFTQNSTFKNIALTVANTKAAVLTENMSKYIFKIIIITEEKYIRVHKV